MIIKGRILTKKRICDNIFFHQNGKEAILFFNALNRLNVMQSNQTKNKRKDKVNKLKKEKKLKNKRKISQRLRAKDTEIIEIPIEFRVYRRTTFLAGLVLIISYLFLLHPLSSDLFRYEKNNVNKPFVLAASNYEEPKMVMATTTAPVKTEKFDPKYNKLLSITKGTPMEKMTKSISERNKAVAAFMIGIAMKESKFGLYSPKKKNGADCYNYWGYRGKENPTVNGYSCFDSPEHAVKVVGDRIENLVNKGVKTPAQMVVWKCGSSCAGHSPESVAKWIKDVSIHYYDIMHSKEVAVNL